MWHGTKDRGQEHREISARLEGERRRHAEVHQGEGVSWRDLEGLTDDAAYALLFPEKTPAGPVFEDPDWGRVHKELVMAGVTPKLLYFEYKDDCISEGKSYMSYDRCCKRYRDFTVRSNVVSRVGHKAGRNMEVDWSGPMMSLLDPAGSKERKVYLFVACLPFSRYSYVKPTLDMKQETWLMCHVHAFEFFGGSTPRIVPDNLKTGVVKHPKEGEVILNGSYEELASHYGSAIIPARARRPRDKPSAENEVWSAATYVIAALRNMTFTDISQLRAQVKGKVAEHNGAPFSKRAGSRLECFLEEEKPLLRALPETLYEASEWILWRKVQLNCHVSYKRNFYLVPFPY